MIFNRRNHLLHRLSNGFGIVESEYRDRYSHQARTSDYVRDAPPQRDPGQLLV